MSYCDSYSLGIIRITFSQRKIAMQAGWTAAAGHLLSGGGKSELRRAVCRITSGTGTSRRRDG